MAQARKAKVPGLVVVLVIVPLVVVANLVTQVVGEVEQVVD